MNWKRRYRLSSPIEDWSSRLQRSFSGATPYNKYIGVPLHTVYKKNKNLIDSYIDRFKEPTSKSEQEFLKGLQLIRDSSENPEKMVTVYRGTSSQHPIAHGDWVSPSSWIAKSYASSNSTFNPEGLVSTQIPAKYLFMKSGLPKHNLSNYDLLHFGYDSTSSNIVRPGSVITLSNNKKVLYDPDRKFMSRGRLLFEPWSEISSTDLESSTSMEDKYDHILTKPIKDIDKLKIGDTWTFHPGNYTVKDII